MRVAETQVAFERTQSRAKSNRALFVNSYNHSFIIFSIDYENMKKIIISNKFDILFLVTNANEKEDIINKFICRFLVNDTNENDNILYEFDFIFSSKIQIKIKIFSLSLIFFSFREYKLKEDHHIRVSSCFHECDAIKNKTFLLDVFQAVSSSALIEMRDLILIKTPSEISPSYRRAEKVGAEFFCFCLLQKNKNNHSIMFYTFLSNIMIINLNVSLMNYVKIHLFCVCRRTDQQTCERKDASNPFVILINIIFLFSYCNERSNMMSKEIRAEGAIINKNSNKLEDQLENMILNYINAPIPVMVTGSKIKKKKKKKKWR